MKYEILTSFSKELRRQGLAVYALMNVCPRIAGYLGFDWEREEHDDRESGE